MFAKLNIKLNFKFFSRIGPRLMLVFCLLFVTSSACVFFFVFTLFSKTLADKDHEVITSKAKEYAILYNENGVAGLNRTVSDLQLKAEASNFLIRLESHSGEALFLHLPTNNQNFNISQIEQKLSASTGKLGWSYFRSQNDEDSMEILTLPMDGGEFLQVGKSSDEREELIETLQNIFAGGLLVTLIISICAGTIFSRRVLKQVRNLIRTIEEIQTGELKARVPNLKTGDELENLTRLFNEMLDKVQGLLVGMRDALDNVAHDLRTPMTRLRSIAEYHLRAPSPPTLESYREALAESLESSNEILTMLNSLMDISEAESGAMKLKFETFYVGILLHEVVDLYELIADEKRISLNLNVDDSMLITADRVRLKQVLANLVDNAVKYTKPGGAIHIFAKHEPGAVKLSVEDTGIGIEPSDLPRIFDRLFRGDASRSERGLGLGLSLVNSIIKAHHGTVAVKSVPGSGSCFEVCLPVSL